MSEYIIDWDMGLVIDTFSKNNLREEIVRCRNCKEFAFGSDEYATVDWCDYWTAYVESPDGFCAWGERKENGR